MPVFSLQFALNEVPTYAGRYDDEDDKEVLAIGRRADRRGRYTLDEFVRVCRWKTPRSGPLVALNTAASIEVATRAALSEATGERERMEALLSLSGVGWPTASVLLHVAQPDRYPILDVRALHALGVRARSAYSFKFWEAYVAACIELASQAGVNGRTFDQALWQWSKERGSVLSTLANDGRSYERIRSEDLACLATIARSDREDRFARRPRWRPYADRVLCVALCQGAALHYVDGRNGVKDFDVYTFYAEHSTGPFPFRWRTEVDFGPSRFGRYPGDPESFRGRRVDLIGRSLGVSPDADPVEAVRHYLTAGRTETARQLARKAVVLLEPAELRGDIIWPQARSESPNMNGEEQVPQAGTTTASAGETPVEQLEALGVRGILRQLARDGQIIDVRCEMPQCYCFRGRSYFEPRSTLSKWSPTADHYPRLKMHGGHLTPDNVRLAHRLCNQRDYIWRKKINALLGKRMSLEEIAEKLNLENVPTIHGTNRWTAACVRKAFVS